MELSVALLNAGTYRNVKDGDDLFRAGPEVTYKPGEKFPRFM